MHPGVCNRLAPFSDVLTIFSWPSFRPKWAKLIPLALVRYWFCVVGVWAHRIFWIWIFYFYLARNFFLHVWYIISYQKIRSSMIWFLDFGPYKFLICIFSWLKRATACHTCLHTLLEPYRSLCGSSWTNPVVWSIKKLLVYWSTGFNYLAR